MSKDYEYYKSNGEICKSCDGLIPEWSFLCPVCFCKETNKENKNER